MTTVDHTHTVVPGSIVDRFGAPWLQSQDRPGLYPLGAECAACGAGRTAFVKVAADSAWDHWRQPVDPARTVEIIASELRAGDVLVTTTRTGRELERPIYFVEHRPTRGAVEYHDEPGARTGWTIPSYWPLRIRPRS